MSSNNSGEIFARGQLWTVLEKQRKGYLCMNSNGDSEWIPNDEIESEPKSSLPISSSVNWEQKLSSTGSITVESVLQELEGLVGGLDSDSQVVIADFISEKRSLVQGDQS